MKADRPEPRSMILVEDDRGRRQVLEKKDNGLWGALDTDGFAHWIYVCNEYRIISELVPASSSDVVQAQLDPTDEELFALRAAQLQHEIMMYPFVGCDPFEPGMGIQMRVQMGHKADGCNYSIAFEAFPSSAISMARILKEFRDHVLDCPCLP